MRIGLGYDIHRLQRGREMILGGVNIPYDKGPLGHSDGDVLLHSVCDAILGALGLGDIGTFFPDTDPAYAGCDSGELLKEVVIRMKDNGYKVSNLDSNLIAQEPKIGPYRKEISSRIASILEVSPDAVSVKGKTSEGVGPTGRGEAIEAQAIVLLEEI